MRFNLINPSDPYTFEADDFEVAAVAVCLLGNGKYPADALGDDADKGNNVPAFLFGGHDEWFESRFGASYEATADRVLKDRSDALARALESVTLGRERRTSLNNIGGKAQELARAIRDADALYRAREHVGGGA
jgi:hypothetical protein